MDLGADLVMTDPTVWGYARVSTVAHIALVALARVDVVLPRVLTPGRSRQGLSHPWSPAPRSGSTPTACSCEPNASRTPQPRTRPRRACPPRPTKGVPLVGAGKARCRDRDRSGDPPPPHKAHPPARPRRRHRPRTRGCGPMTSTAQPIAPAPSAPPGTRSTSPGRAQQAPVPLKGKRPDPRAAPHHQAIPDNLHRGLPAHHGPDHRRLLRLGVPGHLAALRPRGIRGRGQIARGEPSRGWAGAATHRLRGLPAARRRHQR